MDDPWYGNDPTVLSPQEPRAGFEQPAPAGAEWWPGRSSWAPVPVAPPPAVRLRPGSPLVPGHAGARRPRVAAEEIPVLRRREPGLSLALSSLLPGSATVLNGETVRGTWMLLLAAVAVAAALVVPAATPVALGVWAWGAVDGYRSAVRWNRRHEYPG